MSRRTKPRSGQRSDEGLLSYRSIPVRVSSKNIDERSIEAVLATENPVLMPDFERMAMIPEVLLLSGMALPSSRQVPLLDNHKRSKTEDQIGSVRGIGDAQAGELVGRAHFSKSAENIWTKVQEGHVTDVSAGYKILKQEHVRKGETRTIQGRAFQGPINVVTSSRLTEVSVTPMGVDEQAKFRSVDPSRIAPFQPREVFKMDPELLALCQSRGMPAGLTDDAAQKWMLESFRAVPVKTEKTEEKTPIVPPLDEARILKIFTDAIDSREQKQSAHRSQVESLCKLADVDPSDLYYGMRSADEVRDAILTAKKDGTAQVSRGVRIEGGSAEHDKHFGQVRSAFLQRAIDVTSCRSEVADKVFPAADRTAGWEQFRNASMFDMARECLELDGFRLRGLSREEVAIAALGWPHKVGLRSDPGYHTTGSFSKLTMDAVKKGLQVGYTEVEPSWKKVFRQGPSTPDFKMIHRLRIGALGNLPEWPDNTDPEQVSLKDAEEMYRVSPKSAEISFSYQLLVNDDMSMVSRMPQMFGAAAARTVNATAWAQITSNPTMEDGKALFLETPAGNRFRSNLTTGAGAPSVATVQILRNKMRQMRGENTPENAESQDILNLTPSYIVGPGALETDIAQLILSIYAPDSSTFMRYNPASTLQMIVEPLLDANSATAWYLFSGQLDTVEVTFLQGHESPVTRDWTDEKTLSQHWAVLQAYGAKALQHRGMQKHDGA